MATRFSGASAPADPVEDLVTEEPSIPGRERATRASGSDRRRELVEIAYHQIAEKGFEGLRVRDVACEAGINNATLHYYFPSKEALIQGVVEYLVQEFQISRVPRLEPGSDTPLEELRREFEDFRRRLHESPEMGVVLAELHSRARRDPAIARMLRAMDDGWRSYLAGLLQRGMQEGAFRADLDPQVTAATMIAQMKGIGYQTLANPDPASVDRLVSQLAAQIECWLIGRSR
jgi:AcrR family transcriptional regulator